MCCCAGLTSCYGGGCGYCSECVGVAACAPALCGTCVTGDSCATPTCCGYPTSGSCVAIDTTTCDNFSPQQYDANGNPIQGSPTTSPCLPPCSPASHGATDNPPDTSGSQPSAPKGGGSGGGSAGSAGSSRPVSLGSAGQQTNLATKLGSILASLMSRGTTVPAQTILPGQAIPKRNGVTPISPNTFLLVIVVVGILLAMLAFGKGSEG